MNLKGIYSNKYVKKYAHRERTKVVGVVCL